MMKMLLALALLLVGTSALPAQERAPQKPGGAELSALPEAQLAPMLRQLEAELVQLRTALAERPNSLELLSRRGDTHLFLGRFAEAVADYEQMIARDAALDVGHWRLGIAYYFVGAYEKSAAQFAKYHQHDAGDRENGVWKWMADVHTQGVEKARATMLPYTRFDREPFPALYELLAGKISEADLWSGLEQRGQTDDKTVMFFAHYYAGVNAVLLGRRPEGLRSIREAVRLFTPEAAMQEGPGYMWQVARLQYTELQHDLDAQP